MTDFQKAREAAAREIYAWSSIRDDLTEKERDAIRAQLDAALSAFSAHGWELVPKRMNAGSAMLGAQAFAAAGGGLRGAIACYEAMLESTRERT